MSIKEKLQKQVEKKIAPEIEKELGNKSLAYVSRVIKGFIPVVGVDRTRKQVISGIEGDLKRAVRKNPSATVGFLIQDALNIPDYMALLEELDMGEEHLRVLAQEALQKWGKK